MFREKERTFLHHFYQVPNKGACLGHWIPTTKANVKYWDRGLLVWLFSMYQLIKVACVGTRTHSLLLKHPICHRWSDKHTFCVVTPLQGDATVSVNSQRKYEQSVGTDWIARRVQHLHSTFQHCHSDTTKVHNCCLRRRGLVPWSFSAKGKSWEAPESLSHQLRRHWGKIWCHNLVHLVHNLN